jgi:DNA-binding NtrC family response regulator
MKSSRVPLPHRAPQGREALFVVARSGTVQATISPSYPLHILLAVDETTAHLLSNVLTAGGHDVTTVRSVAEATQHFSQLSVDLLIIDEQLPDGTGLEFARRCALDGRECDIVLVCDYASMSAAVTAMHTQVSDYLVRPFGTLNEVQKRLQRVIETISLRRRNQELSGEMRRQTDELVRLTT